MESERITFWKKEKWENGFLKMLFVMVLFFVLLVLSRYVSKYFSVYFSFIGVDVLGLLNYLIPIIIIFYSFTYKKFMFKEYFKEMGLNFKNKKLIFVALIITFLGLFAVVTSFYLRNANFVVLFGLKVDLFKVLNQSYTFLIAQIIAVALWEEIIFRGYLQNLFEAYFSEKEKLNKFSGIFSIILASVIFTLFHFLTFNSQTFSLRIVNIFCGSLVIGYVYYKSRNLWASTFVHGAYNALQGIVEIFITDRSNFIAEVCKNEFVNRGGTTLDLSQNLSEIVRGVCRW